MDQDTVVNEQIDNGRRLVAALAEEGVEVRLAFWAKPTEEEKWFLYLAFSVVDDKGSVAAYRLIHDLLRRKPDLWIDPLEVRAVGLNDSLTGAVLAATRLAAPNGPLAAWPRRPQPSMIRFGRVTLGGVSMEAAYVYPLLQPAATA